MLYIKQTHETWNVDVTARTLTDQFDSSSVTVDYYIVLFIVYSIQLRQVDGCYNDT